VRHENDDQENGDWLARLMQWLRRDAAPPPETVKRELAQWVPEYRPETPGPRSPAAAAMVERRETT
jgi:hypothetical protein